MQNNELLERHPSDAAFFCKKLLFIKRKHILVSSFLMLITPIALTTIFYVFFEKHLFLKNFFWYDIVIIIVCFPMIMFLHELIHAISMVFMGAKKKNISFGVNIKEGLVYCHMDKPVKIWQYRFILITPFLFVGIVPYVLSILYLNTAYSVLFSISISMCCGDILMLLKTIPYKYDVLVLDNSKAPAFYVLSETISEEEYIKQEEQLLKEFPSLK